MTQEIVFTLAFCACAIGAFQLGQLKSWEFARKLRRFNIDLEAWEMEIVPKRDDPTPVRPLPTIEAGPEVRGLPRVLDLR